MTHPWQVVILAGVSTFVIKAAGPVVFGRRPLPRAATARLGLVAPALLAALVVSQAVTHGSALVADARLAGAAVAVLGAWRGVPVAVVILAAVLVTAVLRASL